MHNTLLALATIVTLTTTAIAIAIAHAETTFYGSFRMGVQYTDFDVRDENSGWDITDESSRWGVRGSENLGNGLSAIYQLETRIPADDFNGNDFAGRLAWVGLKGGFGAVKLGSQWTPYYNVAGILDVFNATWFESYNGPFRQNNAVVYETPDSIGFMKVAAMIVMDGIEGKDSIDSYNLGANFNIGPAGFGAAYLDNRVIDENSWVIAADVEVMSFYFAGLYEDYDIGENWQLLGEYEFGETVARGAYGQNRPDGDSNRDEWVVGIEHFFSSRSRVWVEYSDRDEFAALVNVGMRHDF